MLKNNNKKSLGALFRSRPQLEEDIGQKWTFIGLEENRNLKKDDSAQSLVSGIHGYLQLDCLLFSSELSVMEGSRESCWSGEATGILCIFIVRNG